MSYSLPDGFVAVTWAVQLAAIAHAGSTDPYFSPPRTRWDWGGVGGQPLLIAAVGVAALAVCLLLRGWRSNGTPSARGAALLTAALASLLSAAAIVGLSIGH
jgi:hypothetical protein